MVKHLSHSDFVCRDTGHDDQRVVRNHPQNTVVPTLASLLTAFGVADSVDDPVDTPESSKDRSGNGPPQTRDQQCAEDSGVVLVEVLVRALGRVESEHRLLRCRRGSLNLLV